MLLLSVVSFASILRVEARADRNFDCQCTWQLYLGLLCSYELHALVHLLHVFYHVSGCICPSWQMCVNGFVQFTILSETFDSQYNDGL